MSQGMQYLKMAVAEEASDVFLVAGKAACMKKDGVILPLSDQRLMPDDTQTMITELFAAAGRSLDPFRAAGDADFSFAVPGLARLRVNAYRQRGSWAAVIRIVSFDIPDWRTISIPEEVMDLSRLESGLLLFTGTAGSGKTTTQACLIDRINHTRPCHIVTLEDPIEYLHRHDKAIVSQREMAIDTADYVSALRACVRQAPDVILLGEMRDPETIHTAMSAAETGHLVIATLHNRGSVNAIDRIIDAFPSTQQGQIRIQLSAVLKTVVAQQLLPDVRGGLVPVCEILHLTGAVRSLIRDNKNHQIPAAIASGSKEGMISMDQAIARRYKEGRITKDTALHYADKPEQLARLL